MDLDTLLRADRRSLEELYARPAELTVPTGAFRGHYLRSCESPGAARLANRLMVWAGFRLPPFGVDFDRRCWWFWLPQLGVGRFSPTVGHSQWRPAETVRLEYHGSALPRSIRQALYDEVRPLTADLCLGLGGLNRPTGEGELFFFALSRR
jgi:hypothetical protein